MSSEIDGESTQYSDYLELEDQKTTLATVALFSQPVVDSEDNSANDSDAIDEQFDPFKTIYPSEINSSDDEENSGFPDIVINPIKQEIDAKLSPESVPAIPAPPRPKSPAHSKVERGEFDEFVRLQQVEKSLVGFANTEPVPNGWESFAEQNSGVVQRQKTLADQDDLVKAFEVDWNATNTVEKEEPSPQLPEPPRPETPDPSLDEPFYPLPPADHVWRCMLRFPEKKKKVKQLSKYTTDRTWKEISIILTDDRGRCEINLHDIDVENSQPKKTPFRTIRMEPYMQLSRCKLQHYDEFGKLNILKINHVSYRELPGMRPEKFSLKSIQRLVTHKPKQNIALDHIPVYSEMVKFGSLDQSSIRSLMAVFEDNLMRIPSHKDEALNYSREEVCCYVRDEYIGEVSNTGLILAQKARARIFCSAFLNGSPYIVLGINDKWRFGREIVRRADILPMMHDDWISIRNPEFHSCLQMGDYENDHMLKFYALDGCKFELMRFRVSLRDNRELPLLINCTYSIDNRRVSMRCELLAPGFFSASRRSGAVPCEDVEIRIPIPEEWIYHFRVEKHNKYGSVHSTLRKPGRIKGFEKITQLTQSLLPPSLLEASIGLAKYEHIFKSVVWRIPRVPEKNEASYRPHLLTCNLLLSSHDTVPEWDTLLKHVHVEYTMPSSTVSGTTVRSISVETSGAAEKFVKYTAMYQVTIAIDYQLGQRKENALKGLFDADEAEASTAEDEEVDQKREGRHELDETKSGNDGANQNDSELSRITENEQLLEDFVGLGVPVTPGLSQSKSTSQSDLADIFG